MSSNTVILHLFLIDGIGPVTIKKIIDLKPSSVSWQDLYTMDVHQWQSMFSMTQVMARALVTGLSSTAILETESSLIDKHRASYVTLADDAYPALLKQIYAPPAVLYWQGAPMVAQPAIAIVGSRACNEYGKKVVQRIVPPLVSAGFTLVSGGAVGIDGIVHMQTVNAGGQTCVVFGSGLMHKYPYIHTRLFDQIIAQGGTLLSPYAMNVPPAPGHFPARNRVIAGLSKGCVVVQAALKSGAAITARYALDEGRDVFAVPGHIDDELSAGCHALIKNGAILLHTVDDLFEQYGQVATPQIAPPDVQIPFQGLQKELFLACRVPAGTDELVMKTGQSLPSVQDALLEMQLLGVLDQTVAGLWFVR